MSREKSKSTKPMMKRTIKDSIFSDLFGDVRYLIKLYRALHPEDTETTEDDIADITIKNVLTNGQYNDLAFRIRDKVFLLLEAILYHKWLGFIQQYKSESSKARTLCNIYR